ncbi:MAG: efflux RND transporter permease subunit [Spirochaetales bacterium]|nr:efflux RND transporter permease subunit [Spirochaetales bacterium]
MNITELSVRRPVTILIMTLLFTGLAAFMVPDLAVDMYPSTTWPVIMISTSLPGASPEEVEASVSTRIEKQLSNITGVKTISSTSAEGRSSVRLEFDYGVDLDEATNDIRDGLSRIASALPDEADSPQIRKFDSSNWAMMRLIVTGNESSDTLTSLAEDIIQPRLERVEGVASAEVTGGEVKEVTVDLSLNRMEAYGITISAVTQALASQDILLSGGSLEKEGTEYRLRINERFENLNDIRRTVIRQIATVSSGGSVNRSNVVRLEDVADVAIQPVNTRSRVFINGSPSVYVQIMNESDTNTVQVSNAIREALPSINAELPRGISLEILYDRTTMISVILDQVYLSAIQGGLLAMLILFLFLRSVKSTLVIGASIPVSIFITLGAMYFFDLTLNMISLTGLILGLGMIVDNSIVILENIYKYRERGAKLKSAAILGSKEMVTAIVASTLTTLCVFIPLIIWKNQLEMIGQMFQDMIFTVVISLISSLVVALTVVPALASTYLKIDSRTQRPIRNPLLQRIDRTFEGFFTGLENAYSRVLEFALGNRLLVLSFVGVLFMISLTRATTIGLQLQPQSQSDDSVTINLTMPIGTSLDRTQTVLTDMKNLIETNIQGYEDLILTAGSGGWRSSSSNSGRIEITLPPLKDQIDSPADIQKKMRPYLNQFPDAVFQFSSGRSYGGSRSPIDIEIISSDLDLAGRTAGEIRDLLRQLPDIVDPVSSLESGAPEYRIAVNKDRAAALGLTVTSIAQAVNNYIHGTSPVTYWEKGEELSVTVQLKEEDRDSLPDLESLYIITPTGTRTAIANIASFVPTIGPKDIDRENEKRVIHVTASIADGTVATAVQEQVKRFLNESYIVPEGVSLGYAGEARDISRLGSPLIIVLIVAVIMVFAVMASLFESLVDPFIIFFSIPLLLIGVITVYSIIGQPLSLFTIVGVVVLVGIVVNNGIVLVDYTNLLRRKGTPLAQAVREGARSRLRPVLMTSLTTILGMVPLGFFGAEGTETIQTIGQTIVGGLMASTFLTLLVTPVVYSLVNRDRKWRGRRQRKVAAALSPQGE